MCSIRLLSGVSVSAIWSGTLLYWSCIQDREFVSSVLIWENLSLDKRVRDSICVSVMQVIKKASQKTIAKRSRLKAFTKVVNYNHIMPTRYSFTLMVLVYHVLDRVTQRICMLVRVYETFPTVIAYMSNRSALVQRFEIDEIMVVPLFNPSLTWHVCLIHGRPKENWKFRWQHPYYWVQSDSSFSDNLLA